MIAKLPPEILTITQTLEKANFRAFLVGGSVRDLLLGRQPKDWDITTDAKPEQIVALFPKTFYENRFGTVTVVNEGTTDLSLKHVEITPFRLESAYSDQRHPDQVSFSQNLEDDLKRRDFTINALAYNPAKGQVVDLYGGQKDLKDKIIRTVGTAGERFIEDPLRMLRAIRLAAELGFVIEEATAQSIQANNKLVKTVSIERIRDELVKIIMSDEPMIGLVLANKLSILGLILPEIEEGLHVKQNGDHKYDVWEHTLRVLQHSADKNLGLELRLASIFHDIAKPRTRRWSKENNDYTFYGHDVVGAKMTRDALTRLKFPEKVITLVTKLVRNHMFFSDVDKITLSAVRRIIVNVGEEHIWDLMNLRMSDRIGMGRPKESPYRLRKYEAMIEEALRQPTSVKMLKINGVKVTEIAKIMPGPKIGLILQALLGEVLDNPTLNTEIYLEKRVTELAELKQTELEKLAEKGKDKTEEVEEQELEKISSKYKVN